MVRDKGAHGVKPVVTPSVLRQAAWYSNTHLATSQKVRSGHSTSMKERKAPLACQSMKSLRRDSPDVRINKSTGGLSCLVRRHCLSSCGVMSEVESEPDSNPCCSSDSADRSSSVDLHTYTKLGLTSSQICFVTDCDANTIRCIPVVLSLPLCSPSLSIHLGGTLEKSLRIPGASLVAVDSIQNMA